MQQLLRAIIALTGLLFTIIGVGWLLAPERVSPQFGMTLQSGVGLSTQIGDLAAFFLTLGSCMLLGLFTGQRYWFYPAAMLLGLAAVGRTLAWLLHDAALALDMIVVEIVVVGFILAASRILTTHRVSGG